MSMQSENKDTRENTDQQRRNDGVQGVSSDRARAAGTTAGPEAGQDSQQSDQSSGASQENEFPPNETDDEQYDQGTVRRAP